MNGSILSFGEAIVDLIPKSDSPPDAPTFARVLGGSQFNVAIGLARLGVPCAFGGLISTDWGGKAFEAALAEAGAAATGLTRVEAPSPLALIAPGSQNGRADYRFCFDGSAMDRAPLAPNRYPAGVACLHVGSFSALLAPWRRPVLDMMIAAPFASFDLNIRPPLIPPRQESQSLVEACVAQADIVKASEEDLGWLYPDAAPESCCRRWAEQGALVALTRGENGAMGFFRGAEIACPAPNVVVKDTIGAGDSFTAALLAKASEYDAFAAAGRLAVAAENLEGWLRFAVLAGAMTCERAGADPPTRAEILARTDAGPNVR